MTLETAGADVSVGVGVRPAVTTSTLVRRRLLMLLQPKATTFVCLAAAAAVVVVLTTTLFFSPSSFSYGSQLRQIGRLGRVFRARSVSIPDSDSDSDSDSVADFSSLDLTDPTSMTEEEREFFFAAKERQYQERRERIARCMNEIC